MKNTIRTLAAILVCTISAGLISCGGTPAVTTSDTTAQPDSTIAADAGYDYGGKDYGGYEFKVLNLDTQFGCYIRLDFAEQTGEALDDAVYLRNRRVEEALNFNLKEIQFDGGTTWGTQQIAACDQLIQSVMAGDDAYDAAYLPLNFKSSVVTDGYVLNLLNIPELKVHEDYWDTIINNELTINDTLYMASGPLNFMSLDLSWVLLFNQDMMDDYKMEYPYQLVRDGKWTLDKFNEYVTAAVSLNGDESFAFSVGGKAVYGIAGHHDSPNGFLYSAGCRYYETDKSGNIQLTLESERLYSTLDKLAAICTITDGKVYFGNGDRTVPDGYLSAFAADRALFLTCELKATLEERDMESTFGLLPMPKYDENQEEYYTLTNPISEFLVIPKTQTDTSRAGTILDALTWESYNDVLPVYYDVTVSQKGLRNEDSIDMLKIVRETRGIECTGVYNITTALSNSLKKLVTADAGNASGAASTVASAKESVEANLQSVLEALEENK